MGVANAQEQEKGTSSTRYTILGRLASGGMADIYLALVSSEAGVDRHLVLKRVLAERARDPVFCQMFLDEARLAAQLQHPNIAQVYDVGKLEGAYFFTMEYVHGEDVRGVLYKLVKLKKQMPVNLAMLIAAGALSALQYAHERTSTDGKPLGVVHRDVTPSNIMISLDGSIKLLDFGVAKAAQRSQETQSGSIKGKVAYLSPEQCKTSKIDRRTDIYALGIVLWEMLTASRLYRRETDFATMLAITNEPVPLPSTLRDGIPAEVERIVMTALEKDVTKRYQTAAAMLEDIENVATAERLSMSPTAMGRFMKELFGEKQEPWKQLKEKQHGVEAVTVTAESLKATSEPTHTEDIVVDPDSLKTSIEKAPDLRAALGRPPDDSGGGTPLPPSAGAWGEKTPLPADEESKFMSVEPSDPAGEAVAKVVPTSPASSTMAIARPRTPWVMIAGLVAAAVVGGVVVMQLRSSPAPARPATAPGGSAPAATAPAAVPAANAAPVGSPASVAPPTPPAPLPPADDWTTLQNRCDHDSAPDLAACGVAACNAGARAKALAYHKRGDRAAQKQIERACQDKNITLVKAAPAPAGKGGGAGSAKAPPKDPCKDPAYVEANPLKCQ